jgi:hypothetical protein
VPGSLRTTTERWIRFDLGEPSVAVAPGRRRVSHQQALAALGHTPRPPAEFATPWKRPPDPAVPIADFAGNHGLRCDFIGERLDPLAIVAFRDYSAPIWRRLTELENGYSSLMIGMRRKSVTARLMA